MQLGTHMYEPKGARYHSHIFRIVLPNTCLWLKPRENAMLRDVLVRVLEVSVWSAG
jgi:hypothetical protein